MATRLESGMSAPSNSAPNNSVQSGNSQIGNSQSGKSQEWSEHEHISAPVQLEAEKLVDMVGNPELAKQAINAVEQQRKQSQGDSSVTNSPSSGEMPANRKQNTSAKISAAFLKSLTDLETCLATPVVAGELNEWVNNTLRACEKVRSYLLGDVGKIHEDLFKSIIREDVDLSAQVEKLRSVDAQICHADCDEVVTGLKELQNQSRSARQDEAKVAGAVEKVSERAKNFVVAARGQETAISAWLSEAFNRDLGSGD